MAARFRPATAETVPAVLRKLADLVQDEENEIRELWAEDINTLLDDALAQDALGTEGQLDPRGDHRD